MHASMIGRAMLQRAMPREQRKVEPKSVADLPRARRFTSRQARWRERQRNGHAIFKIGADHDAIVLGLIESGRISEADSLDRRHAERAISTVLEDFARR